MRSTAFWRCCCAALPAQTLGAPLSAYTLLLAPLTDGQHFAYNLGAWFLFPLFSGAHGLSVA